MTDPSEALAEAARDLLSGMRYIRHTHGELYGVGWGRCETAAVAALAAYDATKDVREAESEFFAAAKAHTATTTLGGGPSVPEVERLRAAKAKAYFKMIKLEKEAKP